MKSDSDGVNRKNNATAWIARRFRRAFSILPSGASEVRWKILFIMAFCVFAQSMHVNAIFPFISHVGCSLGYMEID